MKRATMVYSQLDTDISDITCLHHNMVQRKDDGIVNSCYRSKEDMIRMAETLVRSKGRHDKDTIDKE